MSAKKVMASQEKVLHLPKILFDYIVMTSQEKVWLILTLMLTDDNDEREESDGQSGEGLPSRQKQQRSCMIIHYYSVWHTVNANDHTDDVSISGLLLEEEMDRNPKHNAETVQVGSLHSRLPGGC